MIDLAKSLKDSILTPASYEPSDKVKKMQHLVIMANDNLLLSLGEASDIYSKMEAKALLNSEEFKKIVSVQYPSIFGNKSQIWV